MGVHVIHFNKDNKDSWGVVVGDQIKVLPNSYATLAEFLDTGKEEARNLVNEDSAETVSLDNVTILSPVTKPARIVCQGANYSTHRQESGLEAQRPAFNLFFTKFDNTLTGPHSDVINPANVKLLDYELELGLVIGKEINEEIEVTDANLHEYVAGIVLTDDISARDIQMTQSQWLKGKSYRTFLPVGPYLYLFDEDEISSIHDLELNLWVNDELRQSANTSQLLFKPAETLTELSQIMDFSKGDLILTGTTGGVAMNLKTDVLRDVTDITAPYDKKINQIVEDQLRDGNKYLNDGDVIRATIKSKDGTIDLGEQKNRVVFKA